MFAPCVFSLAFVPASSPPDGSIFMDILVWLLPEDRRQLPTAISFPDRCRHLIALVQSQRTILQDTVHICSSAPPQPTGLLQLPAFSHYLLPHPFLSLTPPLAPYTVPQLPLTSILLSNYNLWSQPESSDFGCLAILTQVLSLQHLVLLILKSSCLDVALSSSIHHLPS